jgi:hypothetical protein
MSSAEAEIIGIMLSLEVPVILEDMRMTGQTLALPRLIMTFINTPTIIIRSTIMGDILTHSNHSGLIMINRLTREHV